jgi:CSLREA domain-containing protein
VNIQSTHRCRVVALFVTALLIAGPLRASAAVLTVTSAADSGPGSLRDVLAASAEADTIQFAPALAGQTIYLQSTLLAFHSITIDGSSLATPLTLSGDSDMDSDGDTQVLGNVAGTTLTITRVNLTRGHATSFGGCVQSAGRVNLYGSTVSYCDAAVGGGVSAVELMVRDSTFVGNTASNSSGAVTSPNGTIVNSTLVDNSAALGGAIRIDSDENFRIIHATISGNTAGLGGGLLVHGSLALENTIIANSAGGDCAGAGSIVSMGSLVEDASCQAWYNGDPMLRPLQNNGGPTHTMLPASGSTAIDLGDATVCADEILGGLEQRGTARAIGYDCDIGATEQGEVYVVTSDADTDDGSCNVHCTFREAMHAAAAL